MTEKNDSQPNYSFLPYLIELRSRLLKCLLMVVIIFCLLFPFSQKIYSLLALPLAQQLPNGTRLIAIGVASSFLIPLKLIAIVSLFLTVPFFLYQLWAFISPALYLKERRWLWPLLSASTTLFYLGICFVYFLVFPLLFKFLIHTTPAGVSIMPDISQYLDFVLQMFLAFGVVFEVPLLVVLLITSKMMTVESLRSKRPYVIVGAFVIGMLFTPPDVVSQILLAVPLWLLFEIGLVVAKWLLKSPK